MRNEDGTYVGIDNCLHYKGIAEIVQKTCCGGRKSSVALIDCERRGVIEAEPYCNKACSIKEIKSA
jgi:hypothetical protein